MSIDLKAMGTKAVNWGKNQVIGFNGTLASLGAPILRPIAYHKINCKFYNKTYLEKKGINVKNLLKGNQANNYEVNILQKGFKESFERTYFLRDNTFFNGFWFPIGLANTITQYADQAKASLFGELFIKNNFLSDAALMLSDFLVFKPIIVRNESLKISSFVQKKKEKLNSFEHDTEGQNSKTNIKFYEYNDVEGKEYSFNVELFTVMNNLWGYLLQMYLKKWTQTASKDAMEINRNEAVTDEEEKQQTKSIQNYANAQFLKENAFPNEKECLFTTGSYLVYSYVNVFANANNQEGKINDSLSYLFDYYNDAFTLTNLKLTSYDITKNTNGDALTINLQFDKTISCERVFNYETLRNTRKGKTNKDDKGRNTTNESDAFVKEQENKKVEVSELTGAYNILTKNQNQNQSKIIWKSN